MCGLRSEGAQKKLLTQTNLSFQKAVEIAQSMETAEANTKQIHSSASALQQVNKVLQSPTLAEEPQNAVNKLWQSQQSKMPKSCFRCGKSDHDPSQCRYRLCKCHNCGKLGHIRPVCKQPRSRGRPVMNVQEDLDEEHSLNHIHAEPGQPYHVDLLIDGKPLSMEVDTGASLSLISEATFRVHFPRGSLKPSRARLVTYSKENSATLGQMEVLVTYEEQQAVLPLIVVAGSGPSLLGRNWLGKIRLDWKAIKVVRDTNTALADLLDHHRRVFADELGKLKGHTAKIHVDPGAQPRFCKARTVPYAMRSKVEAELQRLEDAGIIEPVQFADWAAPIVPVVKSDKESIRICGDFKVTVNKASKLDRYSIPKIEDLFARLAGGKTFTKLDMSQAYQQIVLDEDSRTYVVINTHRGLFQYNRLLFGVSSAPGIFQRVMESILNGIPGVVVYILVTGATEEEHLAHLKEVLRRLEEAGLRLKRNKCVFMVPFVVYLGHVIDAQGLHPIPDKVRALQAAPQPENVAQLRSYIGLLSYYSKFLPQLATVLAPLYLLLREKEPWRWTYKQDQAFNHSKKLLLSSQVLVHFDPQLEIRLACDASAYGIGAVLSHRMPDGSEKPIGFVSRTLSATEQKYSQIEKEALACVVGVTRFRSYLWGHHFTLQTDHKPLLTLFNEHKTIPQQAANRIQRWAWTLAAYEYTITWRQSEQHANADALSRLPLPEVPAQTTVPAELVLMVENLQDAPITASQIATWTRRDPVMARVLQFILEGWPERTDDQFRPYASKQLELSTQAGCIVWGGRVVIPPPGRQSVLTELHAGHPGVSRMKSLARGLVWWPGMDQEIERVVQQCTHCQPSPPLAPLQPWSWPTRPWSRLHVDYAGPMAGKMFLVVIDAHTKWIEVFPMNTATSFTTIQRLRQLFAQFGIPDSIVSDNGPQFASAEFDNFCRLNGIVHTKVAPYHPSSNGLAERAVKIFKTGVKKQSGGTWSDQIARFLFQYRITPHTTTGISPAELMFGRKVQSRLDKLKPCPERKVQHQQERQKLDHDRRSSKFRHFELGEKVFVKNHRGHGDTWLAGDIIEKVGPLSFKVQVSDGQVIRCHQDHIRTRVDKERTTNTAEDDSFDVDTEEPTGEDPGTAPLEPEGAAFVTPMDPIPPVIPSVSPVIPPAIPTTPPQPPGRKCYPGRDRHNPNWFHDEIFP